MYITSQTLELSLSRVYSDQSYSGSLFTISWLLGIMGVQVWSSPQPGYPTVRSQIQLFVLPRPTVTNGSCKIPQFHCDFWLRSEMVLSPLRLVILHCTVTPIALLMLVLSKSSEEVVRRGSILMKRVSSIRLFTMDVLTKADVPSSRVTWFIIIKSILPFSVKSKIQACVGFTMLVISYMFSTLNTSKEASPLLTRMEAFLKFLMEKRPRRSGYPSKLKSANLGLLSEVREYPAGRESSFILDVQKGNLELDAQISEGELELRIRYGVYTEFYRAMKKRSMAPLASTSAKVSQVMFLLIDNEESCLQRLLLVFMQNSTTELMPLELETNTRSELQSPLISMTELKWRETLLNDVGGLINSLSQEVACSA